MLANVSPDGRVLNVSGGTAVMKGRQRLPQHQPRLDSGLGSGVTALAFFAGVNYDNVRSDGAL